MSTAGERLPLARFLDEAQPQIDRAVAEARDRALGVADYLSRHLGAEPAIAAQLDKLRAALPADLARHPLSVRRAAARDARAIMADVKARWIDADAPPLVDEIDDRLSELSAELDTIERPDADNLAETARRIDALARDGRGLEDLERRLAIPGLLAAVLFVAGIAFFFRPDLMNAASPLERFWTILVCLGALPGLCAYYAVRARPRTRADFEIDRLNRQSFLPNGGLYFPPGEREACVIRVDYTPPVPEPPISKVPRDPRKNRGDRDRPLD